MKEEIVKTGIKLIKNDLTYLSFGNISARFNDIILITPTGIDFENLKPEDIVEMDFKGNVLNDKRPSIEYRMHLEIYKLRPDVNAIIHFHPIYATVLANCNMELEPILEEHKIFLGNRNIKVARYEKPGSLELAKVAAYNLGEANAVLLERHGAVCVGKNLDFAFKACMVLEREAKIFIITKLLKNEYVDLIREYRERIYGLK